jgi:DNA-binding MarR family transcriptional regulator
MPDCRQIAELIGRLGRLAHALQYSAGLNPAQWEALRFLARANKYSRSPSALSEFLGVTRGTASQTLIALEEKGYVERTRSTADRRSVDLRLTDKGLDLIRRDPLCCLEEAATGLSDGCKEHIADGLERVVAALQVASGYVTFGPCFGCDHFRRDPADAAKAGCRCALTGDALEPNELGKICVDFTKAA